MRHRAETLSRRLVPASCSLVGEAVRRRVQADPRDSVLRRVKGNSAPSPSCVMYKRQYDVRVRASNDGRIRAVRLGTRACFVHSRPRSCAHVRRSGRAARTLYKDRSMGHNIARKGNTCTMAAAPSGEKERTAPVLSGAHTIEQLPSIVKHAPRRSKEMQSSGRPKETLETVAAVEIRIPPSLEEREKIVPNVPPHSIIPSHPIHHLIVPTIPTGPHGTCA
jgi:hypothetical protein